MQKHVDIVFQRITSDFLYPLLKAHGYYQRGRVFYNSQGDCEFRASALLNKWGRGRSASVTISAIVAFRRLWEFIRQFDYFARTQMFTAAGCGGGIERMLPSGRKPNWLAIHEHSNADALGPELVSQYQEFVFPFLERHTDLKEAIDDWEGNTSFEGMTRAAAILLTGNRDQALLAVDRLISCHQERYEEFPRASEAEALDACKRFRSFLESADTSGFRYRVSSDQV
ncbi:MAG TPA: hypothetical protein VK797_10620 [Tepidisphaeraceae bacterium]|jgi:hypothetical protein|nr:hypothetical protein [Tepidisphaeraceae bacterium]